MIIIKDIVWLRQNKSIYKGDPLSPMPHFLQNEKNPKCFSRKSIFYDPLAIVYSYSQKLSSGQYLGISKTHQNP